jgi:hypothetical protein
MKSFSCPQCHALNPATAINCRSCAVNFSLHYPELFNRLTADINTASLESGSGKKSQRLPLPCLLLLTCIVGAILVFFMLAWSALNNMATIFRPPEQLPPLPARPRAIRGYDSGYLHQAHPYIETVEGQTYKYEWERGGSWRPSRFYPGSHRGVPCTDDRVQLIERVSAKVLDCHNMPSIGELCPTRLSIAIAEDGAVWVMDETPPCYFAITLLLLAYVAPAILVAGVVLAIGLQLLFLIKNYRTSTA